MRWDINYLLNQKRKKKMNLNHVFFKMKNSLNSELSHLWFVLRRSESWSDLLFCDFWWNIWFWQCDFFTHSVLIQVFVFQPWLCPCGYVCYVCMRVSSYDSLTFIIFLALVCTGKLKFISSTKKPRELPCGLLLKLTVTPQYAITVITHSCPINNTAVIFYWIVCNWGCCKCKGDLGLKLEVG